MQPLLFQPILKRIRWGGTRLGTLLGKPIGDVTDCAESWEIVDHGDDQSIVTDGEYAGWTLNRLVREQGDALFGRHAFLKELLTKRREQPRKILSTRQGGRHSKPPGAARTQFPLLIKFLDAHDRLSLQVHPNDEQAKQYDPAENGKTEAWVILDAQPGSCLYAGLREGVDERALRNSLLEGNLEECLHQFSVQPGDVVYIRAGTVHAIGEGVMLAEVQQSSDLTFRLHDWGRLGSDGQPRELHIEPSFACIDFDRGPVDPVMPTVVLEGEHKIEQLVESDYFVMRRHSATTPFVLPVENRFHVLMMLAGSADMVCGDDSTSLRRGQSMLIPAASAEVEFTACKNVVLLETYLP